MLLDLAPPFVAFAIMAAIGWAAFWLLEPWLTRTGEALLEDYFGFVDPIRDPYLKHLERKAKRTARGEREVDRA